MKKAEVCQIAFFFALLMLTSSVMAQTVDPPHCCPNSGDSVGIVGEDGGVLSLSGEFVISDAMLELQGITRSQFVDRLAGSLFPGKAVDLVLASVEPIPGEEDYLAGQTLVDGQEYYFYKIPRYAVSSEQLDMLDQVGITDGITYVELLFIKTP